MMAMARVRTGRTMNTIITIGQVDTFLASETVHAFIIHLIRGKVQDAA